MKLITRDTDYALRALCFISRRKKEIISAAELVKELKIPRSFLRKLLQILNKKMVLKSYKGKGGGFLLAVPANKVFLVDLIEIFQGPLRLNECFFKKLACPRRNTCALRKKIDRIERYVIRELKSITLASLLK
ncbi:MAG: Rrf2 family transcriptional regulator [Candidatus Omnitrophota bacterium]